MHKRTNEPNKCRVLRTGPRLAKKTRQSRRLQQRINIKNETEKMRGDVAWALLKLGVRNNTRRRQLQKIVRRFKPT